MLWAVGAFGLILLAPEILVGVQYALAGLLWLMRGLVDVALSDLVGELLGALISGVFHLLGMAIACVFEVL
jgi:hypothetical protein